MALTVIANNPDRFLDIDTKQHFYLCPILAGGNCSADHKTCDGRIDASESGQDHASVQRGACIAHKEHGCYTMFIDGEFLKPPCERMAEGSSNSPYGMEG